MRGSYFSSFPSLTEASLSLPPCIQKLKRRCSPFSFFSFYSLSQCCAPVEFLCLATSLYWTVKNKPFVFSSPIKHQSLWHDFFPPPFFILGPVSPRPTEEAGSLVYKKRNIPLFLYMPFSFTDVFSPFGLLFSYEFLLH